MYMITNWRRPNQNTYNYIVHMKYMTEPYAENLRNLDPHAPKDEDPRFAGMHSEEMAILKWLGL